KHHNTHVAEQEAVREVGYLKSMRQAYLRYQNWMAGIYTLLMNFPIGLLGGLYGGLYLTDAQGLTAIQASDVSAMLFLGSIIGSPTACWFSDRIGYRRIPMFIGAILSIFLTAFLIFGAHLSYSALLILFLLLGVTPSTQIIS